MNCLCLRSPRGSTINDCRLVLTSGERKVVDVLEIPIAEVDSCCVVPDAPIPDMSDTALESESNFTIAISRRRSR